MSGKTDRGVFKNDKRFSRLSWTQKTDKKNQKFFGQKSGIVFVPVMFWDCKKESIRIGKKSVSDNL